MSIIIHKSGTRGFEDFSWLKSYHTFSFAGYYNPERMKFGLLRVPSYDTIEAATGFGTHPHDNMEIISMVLEGALVHRDSMGNISVLKEGDIQVMSAGSGITHSEYNHNKDRNAKFLQIWIFPDKVDITPVYDQMKIDKSNIKNNLFQIISPNFNDIGLRIHQNTYFYTGKFEKGIEANYELKIKDNGVYIFIIYGIFKINDLNLNERDGAGIWDVDKLNIKSEKENSEILIIEVSMKEDLK